MLDILRKKRRSWVITFLLGVIIVVFILFYGGSNINEPRLENVAEINGTVITQREFSLHYQRLLERYREIFKGSLTPELIKNLNLRNILLEELIQRHLLLQEARSLGLETTDEELTEAIARIPEFQIAGRFNKNRYQQILRANRLTPTQFESEQREQITIQKLQALIQDAAHITELDLKERYRFENEKIDLQFVRLRVSDFLPQAKVSDEEIQKFYAGNRETLREPLRVQVEYLSYPFDHSFSKVEVTQAEIEDYYKVNRDRKFHKPEEIQLRHILIRLPAGTDSQQKEKARARAQSILEEARTGKDFAQLAKARSDDPTSAQGGEASWFTRGQLLPELDAVAFALKKGEISQIVESTIGYHILKAENKREAKTQSLQEVRDEIVRTLRTEKEKREAAKTADSDREKVLSGSDFAFLAKERKIPLKETGWFARGETLPEVGTVDGFYTNAFSLSPKELSPVIEGTNAYYLLKVKERKESFIPPLESVRPKIEKNLKELKAMEATNQKATTLLEQLKKEKDLKKLAKENGLQVEETGLFTRNAPQIPKIGNLQEGTPRRMTISSFQPVADRVYSQKNAVYLFVWKESRPADMERFEKEKKELMEQALAEKRQRLFQKFIEGLKAKARIKLEPALLEGS